MTYFFSEDEPPFDTAAQVVNYFISKAVYPFRPRGLTLYTLELPSGTKRVEVVVDNLSDKSFVLEDSHLFRINYGGQFLAMEIGFRAAKHFKSLPPLPVNDNVVLSEN